MKGEIIDIGIYEDEFRNRLHRVTIEFKDKPKFRLGECEVNQK